MRWWQEVLVYWVLIPLFTAAARVKAWSAR